MTFISNKACNEWVRQADAASTTTSNQIQYVPNDTTTTMSFISDETCDEWVRRAKKRSFWNAASATTSYGIGYEHNTSSKCNNGNIINKRRKTCYSPYIVNEIPSLLQRLKDEGVFDNLQKAIPDIWEPGPNKLNIDVNNTGLKLVQWPPAKYDNGVSTVQQSKAEWEALKSAAAAKASTTEAEAVVPVLKMETTEETLVQSIQQPPVVTDTSSVGSSDDGKVDEMDLDAFIDEIHAETELLKNRYEAEKKEKSTTMTSTSTSTSTSTTIRAFPSMSSTKKKVSQKATKKTVPVKKSSFASIASSSKAKASFATFANAKKTERTWASQKETTSSFGTIKASKGTGKGLPSTWLTQPSSVYGTAKTSTTSFATSSGMTASVWCQPKPTDNWIARTQKRHANVNSESYFDKMKREKALKEQDAIIEKKMEEDRVQVMIETQKWLASEGNNGGYPQTKYDYLQQVKAMPLDDLQRHLDDIFEVDTTWCLCRFDYEVLYITVLNRIEDGRLGKCKAWDDWASHKDDTFLFFTNGADRRSKRRRRI